MTQEVAEKKLNTQPDIKYLLVGLITEDGSFRLDCCACFSREDARKESQRFMKYVLMDVTKSKNQNL